MPPIKLVALPDVIYKQTELARSATVLANQPRFQQASFDVAYNGDRIGAKVDLVRIRSRHAARASSSGVPILNAPALPLVGSDKNLTS